MVTHAFYNLSGVGDVLMIRLTASKPTTSIKEVNNITALYHNEQLIGYNIHHVSEIVNINAHGLVKFNPTIENKINELLEANGFHRLKIDYTPRFVVGRVLECVDHPDSDHLHVCKVDVKDEILQIVCGASNVAQGQLVVVAKLHAVMPSGLVIVKSKLRGVESTGMICSGRELDLPGYESTKGILVLDNSYQVGDAFTKKSL